MSALSFRMKLEHACQLSLIFLLRHHSTSTTFRHPVPSAATTKAFTEQKQGELYNDKPEGYTGTEGDDAPPYDPQHPDRHIYSRYTQPVMTRTEKVLSAVLVRSSHMLLLSYSASAEAHYFFCFLLCSRKGMPLCSPQDSRSVSVLISWLIVWVQSFSQTEVSSSFASLVHLGCFTALSTRGSSYRRRLSRHALHSGSLHAHSRRRQDHPYRR